MQSKRKISRVFIANRGEIALRIARAARDNGMPCIQPFSEADSGTLPVRTADERIALPGSSARDTYLNASLLIEAALRARADAVHPGYGFLAENAEFARLVDAAGLKFIGPSAKVIEMLGNKDGAKRIAVSANVPVVPGIGAGSSVEEIAEFGERVRYPIVFKAVAGGSGRGLRVVRARAEIENAAEEVTAEAKAAFGDGAFLIEKFIDMPRHIEVQIFGDAQGHVVSIGERECSVQRRYQKLVEESPAPRLHPSVAREMAKAAVRLGKQVGYVGAGTVEFLVEGGEGADDPFYFLEVNTRIQVEHTVTEEVFGIDLVSLQFHVAAGAPLPTALNKSSPSGHAIQFRLFAEDPTQDFRPSAGVIRYFRAPAGPGVREDGWVESGTTISPYYDSLLSKVVVRGASRGEAITRSARALRECRVEGLPSTLGFHRWLLAQEEFASSAIDIGWIGRVYAGQEVPSEIVGPLRLPQSAE